MRVLSDADVRAVLDLAALLPVVEAAFVAQGRDAVERPERPHFPVGGGDADPPDPGVCEDGSDEPPGTALTMPAYVHGATHYATKLASVHPSNPPERPTVRAQIALVEAATGRPAAFLAGTRVTNARTACVGGLAARELAVDGPLEVGVVGAGAQARWQARAIATTASEPTFPPDALAPGTLVVAVGAYTADTQELAPAVFEHAARVFADVPAEAATTGDCQAAGVAAGELSPFADVLEGVTGRERAEEVLVVTSVGSAVLDAAAGEHLFERAVEEGVGTVVDLG